MAEFELVACSFPDEDADSPAATAEALLSSHCAFAPSDVVLDFAASAESRGEAVGLAFRACWELELQVLIAADLSAEERGAHVLSFQEPRE